MSINLIITKTFDKSLKQIDKYIEKDQWLEFVHNHNQLRFNPESSTSVIKPSGEKLKILTNSNSSEVLIDGQWLLFLEYCHGELMIPFISDFQNTENEYRKLIAEVADYFSAVIMHDAGDEILDW